MEIIDENKSKKTVQQATPETQLIYKRLQLCNVDDVVTYEELSTIIGRDVKKNRGYIMTARRMLRDFDNFVFDCVLNIGLKRLSDKDNLQISSTKPFAKFRGIGRRVAKNMNCLKTESLSNDEIILANNTRAMLGVIADLSKNKVINSLTKEPVEGLLPVSIAIERSLAFLRK